MSTANYEAGFIETVKMRFGKISAILLGIAAATICAVIVIQPGWGNPLVALVEPMVIFLIVSSMIVGIIGIIFDRRKLLAIIATIVTGGLVLFFLLAMAVGIISIMCGWA